MFDNSSILDKESIKSNFLEMINSPKDLRLLNKPQTALLCKEIREKIIEVVSKNGGHLGPNLGVVELTIALLYVFDFPKDKIIWDVGHQCYPYKLLTGRNNDFHTLRTLGGISGYPKITESEFDAYGTSHASTSISAALGIAKARDFRKEDSHVIAVIGDGAMTGGLAYEGLNNAGVLKTNLIVILNDNEMSISRNVGAMSNYLRKIVTQPNYLDRRARLQELLRKLPAIGNKASRAYVELEETLRAITNPGMLFKELGFKYFGPINGHDIDSMITALKNIKQLKGPILLHINTKKGKGYHIAEDDMTKYHGVAAFDPANGKAIKKSSIPTYTEVFANTLIKLASQDQKIVAITAAMLEGTGLVKFQKVFPDRCFDVGIAESHAVEFAGGLAIHGMKPVVAIYSTFLQRAYDQIIHDVCLQNLHVVFAMDRAGLVGEDGATQHGVFDSSYLRPIPNIMIMAPKDENELQHMLKTALDYNGPVALRYPRGTALGVKLDEKLRSMEIGKSELLKQGKDILIIGYGSCINSCIEAAKILKSKNIDAAVVNARFLKPLDENMIIEYALKTKKIISVEENSIIGGLGSAILELLHEKNIMAKVKRIAIPDRFVQHGSINQLQELTGLSAESIVQCAVNLSKKG